MQSIIFLAPLTFNLSLEEDPHVNRLVGSTLCRGRMAALILLQEDSIMIWRSICANRLLAKSVLILFLNKMDILKSTLAAGIEVKKFVPSYGDQPNEFHSVVKCKFQSERYLTSISTIFLTDFRDKFRGYHVSYDAIRKFALLIVPCPFVEETFAETSTILLARNFCDRESLLIILLEDRRFLKFVHLGHNFNIGDLVWRTRRHSPSPTNGHSRHLGDRG